MSTLILESPATEAYGGRKVPHPFAGGVKHSRVTAAHVPLVWENMLGTVYARSPKGEVKYFDYDWDAAHAHADVSKAQDLRIFRVPKAASTTGYKHGGGMDRPRRGQLALWGVHPAPEASGDPQKTESIMKVTELFQKKKPNPDYQPPEPPKALDPLSVHGYYMSMSDYHDRQSNKHSRIRDLQKLWSQGRAYHDDRSLFHKTMRDGWAQKALSIDLATAGASPMREDCLEPPKVPMLENRCSLCGDPAGACKLHEAFAGSRPTGILNTIAQNKPASPKVLATPARANVQRGSKPLTTRNLPKVEAAVQAVAEGRNAEAVIRNLLTL